MRKNRLGYLLAQLTLTLEEFSGESGINMALLQSCDKNQDAAAARAVAGYFAARNHRQEKQIILELLSKENRKLSLNDNNVYEALCDYLSCAPCLSKYYSVNGLKRLQRELYTAHCYLSQDTGPVLAALEQFCRRASGLKALETAVVILHAEAFEGREEALTIVKRFSLTMLCCQADPLPLICGCKRVLTGILPNHCLLEVLHAPGPVAVVSYDAVRANSAYLRLQEAVPHKSGLPAKRSSFRVDYLLRLTGMRNDTLAGLLFIDKTLVSKWRNGKRRLHYYDDALNCFACALCRSGPENQRKLRILMEACCDFPASGSKEALSACLCKWLAYREAQQSSQQAIQFSYLSYLGLQGAGDAVQTLLHYCRQMKPPQEIRLTCLGDPEYLDCLEGMFAYLQDCPGCRLRLFLTPNLPAAGQQAYLQQSSRLFHLWEQGALSLSTCNLPFSSDMRLFIALPGIAVLNFSFSPSAPDRMQVCACYDKGSVDSFLQLSDSHKASPL